MTDKEILGNIIDAMLGGTSSVNKNILFFIFLKKNVCVSKNSFTFKIIDRKFVLLYPILS